MDNRRRPVHGRRDQNRDMQRKKEMQRRQKSRRRKWVAVIAVEFVLLLLVGVATYAVSLYARMHVDDNQQIHVNDELTAKPTQDVRQTETNEQGSVIVPTDMEEEQDVASLIAKEETILLIGLDLNEYGEALNSDTMIIANINHDTGEIKLLSVYRDTYLQMVDASGKTIYNKANHQRTIGTAVNVINMLNRNLDLNIQRYVEVRWDGLITIINKLGGLDDIEVIPEEIDPKYKSPLCGYVTDIVNKTGIGSTQITQAGIQHMDGVQAVAWCRVRYAGLLDFGRAERQRIVLEKMLGKATENVRYMFDFVDSFSACVKTNYNMGEIWELASMFVKEPSKYHIAGSAGFPFDKIADGHVGSIPISDPVVAIDLAANVSKAHEFLYGDSHAPTVPTATVREISDYIKQMME